MSTHPRYLVVKREDSGFLPLWTASTWLIAILLLTGWAWMAGCSSDPPTAQDQTSSQLGDEDAEPNASQSLTPLASTPPDIDHVPDVSSALAKQTVGNDRSPSSASEVRRDLLAAARGLVGAYPTSHEALGVMALVQARFGSAGEAEAYWKRSLRSSAQFVDAHHALGDICLERGDYDQAEEHYREALRLDPDRPDVHHRLAEAMISNGKSIEAITLLEKRLEAVSGVAETFFWLGQANLQIEDHDKAKEHHLASIRLDTGNTYAYYGLATACRRLGQKDEAKTYLEGFRRLKNEDQRVELERMANADDTVSVAQSAAFLWSALAEIYARHGDLSTAEQYWRKAGELYPGDVFSREKLAGLYSHQKRLPESVVVMEEICRIRPNDSGPLVALGAMHAQCGNLDAAEESFVRATQVAPDQANGHAALAQLYAQRGRDMESAIEHARRCVEIQPIPPHYIILAEAAAKSGFRTEAKAAAQKATELAPDNVHYRQVYESLGGGVKP